MKFNHKKLKELREALGFSVDQLVYEMRKRGFFVNTRTWFRWEDGETAPDVKKFAFIADFFKTEVSLFFN